MIDVESLDKNKTYVGYQVGTSKISRAIQHMSRKETDIPEREIASHVFALAYRDGEWHIFEAHANWDGCMKLPFKQWEALNKKDSTFYCVERPLNVDVLEFYANKLFNPGYSKIEIIDLAINQIAKNLVFQKDNPGMICSEYIANADKGFAMSYTWGLKCNLVKPIHWQMELLGKGKKATKGGKNVKSLQKV